LVTSFYKASKTNFQYLFAAMVFVNHYLAFDYFSSVWYPFSEVLFHFIDFIIAVQTVKPRPNDRNISMQHIATLFATCCVCLATLLQSVVLLAQV